MKKILSLLLLLTLLTACASSAVTLPTQTATPANLPWWRQAVFYEIFVRSFNDTNADGIGDFNGITQKLDYLRSLGVTAIWLMPIHPSPSYHGYDVLDYYSVNPQYGTMDDFKNLLTQAHSRDIRIIIDLVINHTSSQHPWFVDAASSPTSPYRDWYVWSDTSQGNKWTQTPNGYYYAYFWEGMPDLNYNNRAVTAEAQKMSDYWLNDIGVDGFRIDAAKHLIEKGPVLENTAETHTWFKAYNSFIDTTAPEAYVVGEVAGGGGLLAKSYSNQLKQIFNFELANAIINSVAGGAKSSLFSGYTFALNDKPDGDYAIFLTNHDQNRANSVFKANDEKARVAAVLLFTAPGTPFLYYGEEIGMLGQKPDEDIRLPMQWSADPTTAGFTTATPWRAPHASTPTRNVAAQEADPSSLLNQYRALSSLRRQYKALQTGSVTLLETSSPYVFAMLRQQGSERLLVIVNLSADPQPDVTLSSEPILQNGSYTPQVLYGTPTEIAPLTIAQNQLSGYIPVQQLPPYASIIAILK